MTAIYLTDDDHDNDKNIMEEIVCFKAEYAYQMSKNSQLQSELEKTNVRIRRRNKIIQYYDQYIFNYIFDDDNIGNIDNYNLIDTIDIDKDYKNAIRTIQMEETQRLEAEEDAEFEAELMRSPHSIPLRRPKHQSSLTMAFDDNGRDRGFGRLRSKSAAHVIHANILYQVSPQEQVIEKQWMITLRKKRFKIFVNKQKKQRLQKLKKESQQKLKELEQQIAIKQRMEQLNNLRKQVEILKASRIAFIQTASKELEILRTVIQNL